ncbi:MAG: hypothetical protein KC925_00700 [Candidatus Doudnabacteria bacterium]|nr:hypothetical protein [Candidatus Doudnabacteria bacterium]
MPEHNGKPADPERQQKPEQPVQPAAGPVGTEGVAQTAPPTAIPQPGSAMPQQAGMPAAEKKGKAGKIIFGILGGCLVLALIFGVVAFFGLRKAAREFENIVEEANELQTTTGTLNGSDYDYSSGLTEEEQAELNEVEAELEALFKDLNLDDLDTTTNASEDKRPN